MLKRSWVLVPFLGIYWSGALGRLNEQRFPDDFIFGAASSSHQVEGAWNEDGKGENICDRFAHSSPEKIRDRSNADVTCDSYHRYKEDIAALKKLGVDFYRFSISWARILPSGFPNNVNPAGIRYYNNLINELLANGITPFVTIFHWDLPVTLQQLGGFANSLSVQWSEAYARVLFDNFGDRVKLWATVNEPSIMCFFGYGSGILAPGITSPGVGEYMCAHNIIKAHARIYHLYKQMYKSKQKGRLGIATECQWAEPATNSTEDFEAAHRLLQFNCGLFAHPIFTKEGDYPQMVKDLVATRSKEEGFSRSRLPSFTLEEIQYIKGSSDFMGLNHYTSWMVADKAEAPLGSPSQENDFRFKFWPNPNWELTSSDGFKVVPWGFRKMLKWIKDRYDPEIYILENGYAGENEVLHDKRRVNYHMQYLSNLLDSIYEDKVNVKGYAAWSLMDSFEWFSGYTIGFGLYHVNFSDPARPRTPKDSAKFYGKVIKERRLSITAD